MSVTCPRCENKFPELIKIDPGMRLRLQETNNESHQLAEVCNGCFDQLKEEINQGAKLIAEENQKEQNKKMLWKNRVGYVKEARERMNLRSFAEAAVLYEKYLRAVEIVHDIPAGQLDPMIFNAPGKSSELTILCTVYWDLFKIYDTSDKYLSRQELVGQHLLNIVPYSNVQGDLLKKAERFVREARDTDNARKFLIKLREATGASGCFIATACFDSYEHPQVKTLRRFRDEVLEPRDLGRVCIACYYWISPPIARQVAKSSRVKSLLRRLLTPIAMHIASRFNLN